VETRKVENTGVCHVLTKCVVTPFDFSPQAGEPLSAQQKLRGILKHCIIVMSRMGW
jgi:hypothetical protein